MGRSGYSEDCDSDQWALIRWRGAVNSAIRGKRGQQLLREMAAALDAMPEKRLIADALRDTDGEMCALGVVGQARGINLEKLDPEDYHAIAKEFGIAHALVQEIEFENDEDFCYRNTTTPEQRWSRVRKWVAEQIIGAKDA